MTQPSDEEIARSIRERRAAAFDAFFDRFGAALLGYLAGMVGHRAVAEDLLQETVLRVHRNIDRYQERGSFRSWVFRIATNLALTHLRRARFTETWSGDALEQVADPRPRDVQGELEHREQAEAMARGLEDLPAEQRAVLLLRVRDGRSIAEVAHTLCIPEGTVKSRLHHAVARLRLSVDPSAAKKRERRAC
jgi:RNA polymerase sigma-70 factor (ECF subfamily)